MHYKGSCHCGRITFHVEGELAAVVSCNCSICSRKGALLWAVPRDKLTVDGPEVALRRYTFHTHAIVHRFCDTCGIHPFSEQADGADGAAAYVNVRCLDDVDLAPLEVIAFDGRAM